LQHHKEQFHPYNTAIIAELSLANCSIIRGEDFTYNKELNKVIEQDDCLLLFPSDEKQQNNLLANINNKTIIVIDGSWRKAKKIFYLSKNLHSLPKLTIKTDKNSLYTIRKTKTPHFLSTIESIKYVLETNHKGNYNCLLTPLEKMIDYTLELKGENL
jgi:DTW domain-containing protein YfiP